MPDRPLPSPGKWISCLYRMSQCYLERKLAPLELHGGIFLFLIALFEEDNLSQEELRERVFFDKGTTARALAKMESRGLVRRDPDPHDRRVKRVRLTRRGREAEEKLREILDGWNSCQKEGIPAEDIRITMRTLEKMGRNTAAHLKRKKTEKANRR